MHRNPGQPPADIDAAKPRGHGAGRRSSGGLSTLRELWRFKDYGRPERKSLVLGVLMNGGQMAASLAAPRRSRWDLSTCASCGGSRTTAGPSGSRWSWAC